MVSAVSAVTTVQAGGRGMILLPSSLRHRSLTTSGRPTPTAVTESQWGEPRVTVAGPAAPNGLPLVLAISDLRGGQLRLVMSGMRNAGRGIVTSLSFVEPRSWSDVRRLSLSR